MNGKEGDSLAVETVGNLIAFCSSFLTMFPFIPHRSSIWRNRAVRSDPVRKHGLNIKRLCNLEPLKTDTAQEGLKARIVLDILPTHGF
jgi:hypothetical protein